MNGLVYCAGRQITLAAGRVTNPTYYYDVRFLDNGRCLPYRCDILKNSIRTKEGTLVIPNSATENIGGGVLL